MSQMAVIKLKDGTLWVHSPVHLDQDLQAEVRSMMGFPRVFPGLSLGFPRVSPGLFHGFSQGSPWVVPGFS